jgi:hypothetical protein
MSEDPIRAKLRARRERVEAAPGTVAPSSTVVEALLPGRGTAVGWKEPQLVLQLSWKDVALEARLEQGRFVFGSLDPARYRVQMLGPDGQRFSTRGRLEVKGPPAARPRVHLAEVPVEKRTVRVVVSSNGKVAPFRGVVLIQRPLPAGGWDTVAAVRAGARGRLGFPAVAGASYLFTPAREQARRMAPTWELNDRAAPVSEGQDVVLARRSFNLIVVVRPDVMDEAAVVTAYPVIRPGTFRSAQLNELGHAVLDLPPGAYDLVLTGLRVDVEAEVERITIVSGGDIQVRSPAIDAPGAGGRRRGAAGGKGTILLTVPARDIVPDRVFQVANARGRALFLFTVPEGDGQFRLPELAAGRYRLSLVGSGEERWDVEVVVAPGREIVANFSPEPRETRTLLVTAVGSVQAVWLLGEVPTRLRFETREDGALEIAIPTGAAGRLSLLDPEGALLSPRIGAPAGRSGRQRWRLAFGADERLEPPDTNESLVVAYPDGWVQMIAADASDTLVRAGTARVFRERDGVVYDLGECQVRDGTVTPSGTERIADREEVRRLLT